MMVYQSNQEDFKQDFIKDLLIKNDVYLQSSYKEKSFDVIVCHHVFEHFSDIDLAIKSFHVHLTTLEF